MHNRILDPVPSREYLGVVLPRMNLRAASLSQSIVETSKPNPIHPNWSHTSYDECPHG